MPPQKLSLHKTAQKDGGFYRLVSPPKTFLQQIRQFAERLILFPYHVYQTVIGRLLSYLVINPLFRAEEKDESLSLQHPKHPDPLFSKEDEITVINIYPKKHILQRAILNWHSFLVNNLTSLKIVNSLLGPILRVLPSGKHSIDKYLDKLIEKIAAKVEGKKGQTFAPNQIHFRGLENLSEEQKELFYQKLEKRLHHDFRQNRQQIYFYTLQTTDNSVLDSVEVRGPDAAKTEISERHFIIAAMPRSNNFVDWLKHYQVYAKNLNATIIGFNYRGVGLSTGIVTNQNSLYADAYAQAQRLLLLGARPENIALMGECLGGNVAAHTAGTLHEEGLPVKLFNARSFRSLSSIIEGRTKPAAQAALWHPATWFNWLTYALIKLILIPVIHSANWDLNIDKQFTTIPPHDRDFLVVRSKKDDQGRRFADDIMVPHKNASTYSLVKEQTKVIAKKQEQGQELSEQEKEWLNDQPNQHKFYVSEALHHQARTTNGHTAHPRLLISTTPRPDHTQIDGRQYAFNFFNRVWPKRKDNFEVNSAENKSEGLSI
ncbi:hypothetical protein [Legionella sp. km772]|uniref:hypothetical protein n=1 Tax=Legionella sp. km772 TaxID=2498111 RepID=UPI000F8DCA65|nr:hypothetical protein [Legionella sp. km772]RUR04943.1 hypothetical protein ELY15_14925 [Legionella sp. km772]